MADKFLHDVVTTFWRRHNLYCCSTHAYNQNEVIAWLMLRSFRMTEERRQADLFQEWFIDNRVPKEFQGNNFIDELNITKKLAVEFQNPSPNLNMTPIGSSSKAKVGNIFNALIRKPSTTKGQQSVYDKLEDQISANILGHPRTNYIEGTFKPDQIVQPNPKFARQTHHLKVVLAAYTFNPDWMGIY